MLLNYYFLENVLINNMIRANLRYWNAEVDLGYGLGFKMKVSWSVQKYIIVYYVQNNSKFTCCLENLSTVAVIICLYLDP